MELRSHLATRWTPDLLNTPGFSWGAFAPQTACQVTSRHHGVPVGNDYDHYVFALDDHRFECQFHKPLPGQN